MYITVVSWMNSSGICLVMNQFYGHQSAINNTSFSTGTVAVNSFWLSKLISMANRLLLTDWISKFMTSYINKGRLDRKRNSPQAKVKCATPTAQKHGAVKIFTQGTDNWLQINHLISQKWSNISNSF